MGELIKTVGRLHIGNDDFDIEVNEGTTGNGYNDIHIQNKKFRVSIPENEFLQMGAAVLLARKQLHLLKGIDERKDK
ncbi:hypothetical protein [Butyrivibrio fibrisolvens]|uniref:hypothetical protein n=1 Tax=Butyrivibrio fibrisolvens TaxID=831 RepID=UPI0003F50455|nr:hypothetical protein [Butyrivibrio fibrisolvens]